MLLRDFSDLIIYFQDAASSLPHSFYVCYQNHEELLKQPEINNLKNLLGIHSLFTNKQTHSNKGYAISNQNEPRKEGDYLITNQRNVGIGVYVADCLPVILHDPINQAIGVCHAGWAGSLSGVIKNAINDMQQNYGTQSKDLKVFFGPSAKPCCYEVKSDFLDKLSHLAFVDQVITTKNNQLRFNLPLCNKLLLNQIGLNMGAIDDSSNICTICNVNLVSYRRDGTNSNRALAVVALK